MKHSLRQNIYIFIEYLPLSPVTVSSPNKSKGSVLEECLFFLFLKNMFDA